MGKWRLFGYDTLSEEYYPLEGKYDTKEEAMLAAESHLAKVEQTQPSESSGGQEKYGVQDRVYIERPDGSRYQYLPGDVFE